MMARAFFSDDSGRTDTPHFRKTRNRVVVILLAAALLSLLMIGGGFYIAAASGVKTHSMAAIAVVLALAGVLIVGAVLLKTNELVSRLETKRRSLDVLDRQLRRSCYLAASMELSFGTFDEVKEALANIDSCTAVLKEHPALGADGEPRASIDGIDAEVRRGRRALERLMEYIQPEPPLIRNLDVHAIIDDLLAILDRELRFRNIAVQRCFAAALPPVRSDRAKLRQVFQNLVLNAVEAVDRNGSIVLTTAGGADALTVTIADTGPGISDGDMAHIYEPLWTTKPQGTGLGLPICRDILGKLGGRLSLVSRLGQGTEVSVALPLAFAPGDSADAAPA